MDKKNIFSRPLHPRFGILIDDVDLNELTSDDGYREIRQAFESHSLLYFRNQTIDDAAHLRLAALFGPREDRTIHPEKPDPVVSLVSNVKADNSLLKPGERALLQLQSNMLWHTDSTFLPVPALANILVARVIPVSGSSTEFCSTRASWADMPEALKARARELYFRHSYSHSRRKIDNNLAKQEMFTHWGEQVWKSIWKNPVNGVEALYIASHVCGAIGMADEDALALIDELLDWCTRPQFVYRHDWRVGDVLIWDERATLHRGVAWNYDEARVLSSICVSVTDTDGLNAMRFIPDQQL